MHATEAKLTYYHDNSFPDQLREEIKEQKTELAKQVKFYSNSFQREV